MPTPKSFESSYCSGTVRIPFPLLPLFSSKESSIADALQPVSSDRKSEVGERLTHHLAGDHRHFWYLFQLVHSFLTDAVFSRPILRQRRDIRRVSVGNECDPPGLPQTRACLLVHEDQPETLREKQIVHVM